MRPPQTVVFSVDSTYSAPVGLFQFAQLLKTSHSDGTFDVKWGGEEVHVFRSGCWKVRDLRLSALLKKEQLLGKACGNVGCKHLPQGVGM
jgi:hypothetical protein